MASTCSDSNNSKKQTLFFVLTALVQSCRKPTPSFVGAQQFQRPPCFTFSQRAWVVLFRREIDVSCDRHPPMRSTKWPCSLGIDAVSSPIFALVPLIWGCSIRGECLFRQHGGMICMMCLFLAAHGIASRHFVCAVIQLSSQGPLFCSTPPRCFNGDRKK